ncbi:TniQ family protein [Microbacterium sp. NPDC076895]|uniref:TniQ family protein n=1 Tax=Microbacterium sp. NPDC076895 TaxID=3154957 RepID=UPI00342A1D88
MGDMTDEVRVLPFRVRPLPDEPFDSWVEALAAANRATIAEMGCALGLIEQRDGRAVSATSWMASQWATELTDRQAQRLEQSTGVPAVQFQEMTRMRFARHAIRYTRQGRISSRCPVGGTAGRYCPECLADSGGRWRMSWQFPFTFACVRHRRILADECPECGRPPRRTGHPLAGIPQPGHCHNPLKGAGTGPIASRCRTDLTTNTERIAAPDAVLHAQRRMMQILATGQGRFGIYEHAPQPAVTVLEDIRLLTRTAGVALSKGDRIEVPKLDAELLTRARKEKSEWSWAGPTKAADGAVAAAIAVAALEDPDRAVTLMTGRVAVSTSYAGQTPQLQTLIAAALGRRRRPTVFLQSAPPSGMSPTERAREVPAQLWGEWVTRYAPQRVGNEIAASALAAAVVFTGTRLTHSAALALLDPHAPARQVTHVMRDLGRSSHDVDTLHAILRLTTFLDTHHVPIDYARRRDLDYTGILPESQWQEVCRAVGVSPGSGRRWRLARAFLYRMLSGNPLRTRPAGLDAAGVTSHTVARFIEELPQAVRARLEQVAAEFLAANGIDEPITWIPPFVAMTSADDGQLGPALWPPSRPARAAVTATLPPGELVRAYAAGASTYEIAADTNVSRQTVGRILADVGTPTRRGRPPAFTLDPDWLRDHYETQKRTMAQIAHLAGCSEMTINRHLHLAGITVRQRGKREPDLNIPAESSTSTPMPDKPRTS